jgi:hypothetical protein
LGKRVVMASWMQAASATLCTSASLASSRPYRMLFRMESLNSTVS